MGYGDLVPKNWFSRLFLVALILFSWVLVAHAIGEFLDRMVRLELKNEKAEIDTYIHSYIVYIYMNLIYYIIYIYIMYIFLLNMFVI